MSILAAAKLAVAAAIGRIALGQDWTRAKAVKEGLLAALAFTRPGAGITVEHPNDPITVRAVNEILAEHPGEYEITDFGMALTLMRRLDAERTIRTPGLHAELVGRFDVLTADNMEKAGLLKTDRLPPRPFRDGVPADFNDGDPFARDLDFSRAPVTLYGPDGRPVGGEG